MTKENINIAFILDDNFMVPTVTALNSLFKNKKKDKCHTIYLIANDLSDKNKLLLESYSKDKFNIKVIKVAENFEQYKIQTKGFHVSTSAILKFMLPVILTSLDKVLYLDGDIIIQKDLSNLYSTNLENKYAAVVEDLRPKYRYVETQLEKLNITQHRAYFNSGVMLLNLNKMREDDISRKLFDYRSSGVNIFMDQDALNVVLRDNVIYLNPINNCLITLENDFDTNELNKLYKLEKKYRNFSELIDDAVIIHYSSKYKPWLCKRAFHRGIWDYYFNSSLLKNSRICSKNVKIKKIKKCSDIVISLTSYPARINTIYKTIKSMLNQTLRPYKIVLVLGEDKFPRKELDLPEDLTTLFSDRFEILWTQKDLRSYTKLIPTLKAFPDKIIVTADDDVIYNSDWLEKLYKAYKKNPKLIHCHRAHKIKFDEDNQIMSYNNWKWNVSKTKPSFNNFLTGVGGVLYPPNSLYKDIFNIELFQKLAPMADDIWFWAMAVLQGTKISVTKGKSKLLYTEGTQEQGLCKTNVDENKNDEQLANVFNHYPQLMEIVYKDYVRLNMLKMIFSVRNDLKTCHKVVTICGLKIKIKSKKLKQKMHVKNLEKRFFELEKQIKILEQTNQKTKKENDKKILNIKNQLYRCCSPEMRSVALSDWYYEKTGEILNLDNPQTFNEKIQWLKLYDSTPLKTKLADKYLVRDWIREKIGEEYLIPLLGAWNNFNEIDFDKLPNQFVLKCNHGSGYNIIIKDKSQINLEDVRKKINNWMNENFAFKNGFEMHYSEIPRKIIAEEYVSPSISDIELQVWCFNGKVKFISYETCKDLKEAYRGIFSLNWEIESFMITPQHYNKFTEIPEKPEYLNNLIQIATELCQGFKHARIDFIPIGNNLKFREITFTSGSGLSKFEPDNVKYELGDLIRL